jgi:transposase
VTTIEKLKAENMALKSLLSEREEKINKLEKLNDWYIEQLKLRQKEKFGTSSEKADTNQLTIFDLFNEAETLKQPVVMEPTEETIIKEHKRKKSKRGESLSNLPVETIEYKLDEDQQICEKCGEPLTVMKKEIRKELKIVPAKVSIVEHITYVYTCRNCDKNGISGTIVKAESPKALIPKSFVSPNVLAYLINQKYTNAMPLYRQEQEFNRFGINLNRQNLSNWILKGADLLKPLAKALKEELLSNDLLHADETVLEVLHEPGREAGTNSYMWLYRTSGCAMHQVILFDYQIGRSGKYAKEYLKEWEGQYLHCDGWNGYKQLEDKTLCGCFVHAKRKFKDAWNINKSNDNAKIGTEYIQKLFHIEKKADDLNLDYDNRLKLRQSESAVVIKEFYSWLEEMELKTLPKSLLGEAIGYALKQKEYLCSFLKDGRIELSNNKAEQSIKMFVIGRKNFLFSNTPNGAAASALLYSIIQTSIANDLKPFYYLEYIFERIQKEKELNIKDILPWSDKIPDLCKK